MSYINSICTGSVKVNNNYTVSVEGTISSSIPNNMINKIQYIAAAPGQRLTSFTGSLLPYTNANQAFESTPTKGMLQVGSNREFSLTIHMPNSYYGNLGSVIIPPTLYLNVGNIKANIVLHNPVPFRSITYPMQRSDVLFYDGMWDLPVRTQEDILRSTAFNLKCNQSNFWGEKPPI
jgi:hypothetical protein